MCECLDVAPSGTEPGESEARILADALAAYMPERIAGMLCAMPRTRDTIGRHHAVEFRPTLGPAGLYVAAQRAIAIELTERGLVVRDGDRFRLSILGRLVVESLDDRPVKIAARAGLGEIVTVAAEPHAPLWRRLFSRSA